MWTWIIVAAVAVAIATLILWRQRTRKGTAGTPDNNMRARAGKARKMDGGKSGGYPGKTGGFTPGNPG